MHYSTGILKRYLFKAGFPSIVTYDFNLPSRPVKFHFHSPSVSHRGHPTPPAPIAPIETHPMAQDSCDTSSLRAEGASPGSIPPPSPPLPQHRSAGQYTIYDGLGVNAPPPAHTQLPMPPPLLHTEVHTPSPPPCSTDVAEYTKPDGLNDRGDTDLCAYLFFGIASGLFLGIFALFFLMCQCMDIRGRRRSRFLIGWGVGFVVWLACVLAAITIYAMLLSIGFSFFDLR